MNTNCMSPWWNLSVSSWVARADSEVGSWNPPAERLLATGMPKIAAPTIVSAAMAMMRRGAARANSAILCSTSHPSVRCTKLREPT